MGQNKPEDVFCNPQGDRTNLLARRTLARPMQTAQGARAAKGCFALQNVGIRNFTRRHVNDRNHCL